LLPEKSLYFKLFWKSICQPFLLSSLTACIILFLYHGEIYKEY